MTKESKDSRITAKRHVWVEYLVVWFIMLCLSGGQALILSEYFDLSQVPVSFIFANVGYWGLMTLIFCLITWVIRKRNYDKPIMILSAAAKQVAEGDFSIHIDPIRKDGKKDYVEVMFEDFNKMVDELGSIEVLTSDFVSNVSHEIKTPLAIIQSYAMALQKADIDPTQRREYTDTIILASQKLNALVANILKLSKLENQRIQPLAEDFDLCRQLCDCALAFESLWEDKNITFTVEMDDRAVVCADRSLLEIVWNNLLSNALKFTEPGGTVTLTQTSDEDTVTVTVSDTGCGIAPETMHRIFDKFYQGDSSHSGEGNGLGLALSLRAVELAGGAISVKSEPGKGTVFTVQVKAAR
jgi:signal transduction histidine kinase